MSNTFDSFKEALAEAERINRIADNNADEMAALLLGRLRHVTSGWRNSTLRKLKKELAQFDAAKGQWKN